VKSSDDDEKTGEKQKNVLKSCYIIVKKGKNFTKSCKIDREKIKGNYRVDDNNEKIKIVQSSNDDDEYQQTGNEEENGTPVFIGEISEDGCNFEPLLNGTREMTSTKNVVVKKKIKISIYHLPKKRPIDTRDVNARMSFKTSEC
jgi:hypothetical protein